MKSQLTFCTSALNVTSHYLAVSFQAPVLSVLSRCLHLQEYQSKTLMKEHEIEVQHFEVVDSVEDAKYVPPRLRKISRRLW